MVDHLYEARGSPKNGEEYEEVEEGEEEIFGDDRQLDVALRNHALSISQP